MGGERDLDKVGSFNHLYRLFDKADQLFSILESNV